MESVENWIPKYCSIAVSNTSKLSKSILVACLRRSIESERNVGMPRRRKYLVRILLGDSMSWRDEFIGTKVLGMSERAEQKAERYDFQAIGI